MTRLVPVTPLRPEVELLLCCARTRLDSANSERLKGLIQSDIDWSYCLRLAARHETLPLLYRILNTHCPEAVPQATLAQLRSYFHANARRNSLLTRELVKVLDFLEAHQIAALAYKGPMLAVSAYGNLALRQFIDLDLVVQPRDILAAKELLISQGYRWLDQADASETEPDLDSHYHFQFARRDGKLLVEVHWAFSPERFYYPLEIDRLWERAISAPLGGKSVRCLCPEDLLLTLSVHLGQHCWRGKEKLKWICDLAELTRQYPDLDWGWILAQANKLGSQRMLGLGLSLAHDLLDAPLPSQVEARITAESTVNSLAAHVRERLAEETSDRLQGAARYIFYLKLRERWQNKMRRSLDLLCYRARPNDQDRTLLPLPKALHFLYYLTRPIRLLRVYGLDPMRAFLKQLR